ncbi:MAG TPA: ATP-binding cassette domain-containing protein [Conexibacter sp.]
MIHSDANGREPALLSARGLKKSYGAVKALDGVDLELRRGEIVALIGDNGAGKSTLVSLISGLVQPDAGTIEIDGQEVVLDSPHRAQELGIATVFQNLALVEQRDVAANLFLGRERRRWRFFVDRRRMLRESTETIRRLKVGLPSVRALVGDLSGGQRQAIAIARAIMQGSRIVLMDEPTAALGVREARRVLDLICELRAEGHSVLLISHNMDNVFELADRAAVFRQGRKIAERARTELDREEIVGLIVHGGVTKLDQS